MLEEHLSARQRQALYYFAFAAMGLLVSYNIVGPEQAPLWMDVIANLIGLSGTGTAAAVLRKQRRDGTVE